jgi:pimeloyl-ACP methyl ester carboxylesterase
MQRVDIRVDVTGKTELAGALSTAVRICLPEPDSLPSRPIVAFCYPGGRYSRLYYDIQMPGHSGYSQAEHHAEHGIILVAADHLGVGDSSDADRTQVTYENVTEADRVTVDEVVRLLATGELDPEYPAILDPVLIGMGQSYGALLVAFQQGRLKTFDGMALLGYGAFPTVKPVPPSDGTSMDGGTNVPFESLSEVERKSYFMHWEDIPNDVYELDMRGEYDPARTDLSPWASRTRPGGRSWSPKDGPMTQWANVIECPVLIAVGERDVSADPWSEPTGFRRCRDITVFVCPKMAHSHNIAGTRRIFWDRLVCWMTTVAAMTPTRKPTNA